MTDLFLSQTPFVPHDYADIADVYPPGAMPELAYQQYCKKLAAIEGVTIQRITYESDGLEVNGLMALPANASPGNHPIMLYCRGGFRHYGMLTAHSVMRNLVPFAQQGYLCVAPNYRGNDGGEGEDHFAGDDVQDVVNLLALTKQHEAYNGAQSYMIGHSRGGMMTLRALASGAEVNAAICIAGLTDLMIGGEEDWRGFLKYIPANEQADPKAMLARRSAAHWPEKLQTPLLLMHGDTDTIVPHEHSERLYQKLQSQGTPSELVLYPGGNHALVKDWSDVLSRSHAWMEHYAA